MLEHLLRTHHLLKGLNTDITGQWPTHLGTKQTEHPGDRRKWSKSLTLAEGDGLTGVGSESFPPRLQWEKCLLKQWESCTTSWRAERRLLLVLHLLGSCSLWAGLEASAILFGKPSAGRPYYSTFWCKSDLLKGTAQSLTRRSTCLGLQRGKEQLVDC